MKAFRPRRAASAAQEEEFDVDRLKSAHPVMPDLHGALHDFGSLGNSACLVLTGTGLGLSSGWPS
jgi:hypothetical protein